MKEGASSERNITARSDAMSGTIHAIVVDDEPLAREELSFLLRAHPDVQVVGTGHNGLEALELIQSLEPDVVFVDVAMPGLDGIGLVRQLIDSPEISKIPHIIFATAYDQYAVQAFELNAIDYLLKPIDKTRLAQSLQRVRRQMENETSSNTEALQSLMKTIKEQSPQQSKLLVRCNQHLLLVDAHDLIYASIEGGLITMVTKDFEGESNYKTIEELQAHLDPNNFWRVHRSYLININHIKEVVPWFKSSYQLKMDDRKATEIPVSRAQTKRLRELLNL